MAARWLVVLPALAQAGLVMAQSAEEMNKANNPLTPSIGVNLQDQYVDSYYGPEDADSNTLMLRGTLPHRLFGQPQILRLTLPYVTTPSFPPAGSHSSFSDVNIFDLFLFKRGGVELGVGPQLTIPTASKDETGTGKWQAGLATLAVAPQAWGLIGGLVTWQHSFAGDSDRRTQNNLQAQPFLMRNLPRGWYLRSTATWSWDLAQGTYYIPVGAGAGKVWKGGNVTFNFFVEPQWTVAHDGDVPKFQIFGGLNLQFPL